MIKIYRKTVKDERSIVTSNLDGLKGSFLYCIDPSKKEVDDLATRLSLNRNLIADVLDLFEVPRLDESNGAIFVISSFPVKENERLIGIPFAVAANEDSVAIIASRGLHFLEDWFEGGEDFITTQKTKLVNLIFRKLMEEYHDQLMEINKEVHRISLAPGQIGSDDITRLVWFEESLNLIVGDLIPTDKILRKILSGKKMKLYDEDKELIEDTVLYTEQLIEMVQSNLKKISNLRDAYSTILTANLNSTMKFLTAATVILTVPTIVASIYGMNVVLPLGNHPLAFLFIILSIIGFSLLLIYLFIKKNWF